MDQMSKFEKKKQLLPFDKLFRVVSPKEFINLFNSELPQTKAFILSFSPRKDYVHKVIRLLDTQESNESEVENRSSFVIREYLNRCREDIINLSFVQAVEKEIESMITGYESFNGFPNPRKRFF
jgi:flagellar motor switch protein FliG